MKHICIGVLIALAVAGFFGSLIHGLNEDIRTDIQREREWLQFSMQHHCHVARDPSFSDPATTWQCDGFEVKR